ncbi:unnamed protein product, partial [Rotaria sordida]
MSFSNLPSFLLVVLLESLLGIATVHSQCITTLKLDAFTSKVEPLDYPIGHHVTYEKNSNCKWLISAPQSYCIRFNFTMLSTESGYDPDIITVYDGQTASDRQIVKSDSDVYVGDGFTLQYQAVPNSYCGKKENEKHNRHVTINIK